MWQWKSYCPAFDDDVAIVCTHVCLHEHACASIPVRSGVTLITASIEGEGCVQTLDKFSCVALAGVATEYIKYEEAEGGLSDIQQVRNQTKKREAWVGVPYQM